MVKVGVFMGNEVKLIFVECFNVLHYEFSFLGVTFSLYEYIVFELLATVILGALFYLIFD